MFIGRLLENPNKSIGQERVSLGKNGIYMYYFNDSLIYHCGRMSLDSIFTIIHYKTEPFLS